MAHPFRKMTTQQLRRLLKDDRERNRILTEPPEHSDSKPPVVLPLRIKLSQSKPLKISSNSR